MSSALPATAIAGPPVGGAPRPRHARVPAGAASAARIASLATAAVEGVLRLVERVLWPFEPRPSAGRREKVAILRVGLIGDTLAALPAFDAVRRRHPDAEVVLLTSPGDRGRLGAAGLVDDCPALDRVVVWHADEVRGVAGQLHLARRLRSERFDRVYLLPQELTTPRVELRNLAFLRLCGARWVRGVALSHAGWLPERLARAHHAAAHFEPEWRRLLDLVARSGAPVERPVSDLGRSPAADAAAAETVADHGLDRGPLLALGPGQNRPLKRWPVERFADVGARWIAAGGRVCVLGGPAEQDLGAAIVAALGPDAVDLTGRLDLPASAALLRRARALISNDTGTMHLGAAVGCPTVAVFSGWDRDGSWLPFGERFRALREPVPCAPCFRTTCDRGGLCLETIESARAWSALADLLDAVEGPGSGARATVGTALSATAQVREPNPAPALSTPKATPLIDR